MNDLECLKINYDVDGWQRISARDENHCCVPLGSVYAIRSLIDQFWMHDDPENSFATDLYSLIDNEYCNAFNSPDDFIGCEFRAMRSVRLPDITVKITGYKTDDGEANEWLWKESPHAPDN